MSSSSQDQGVNPYTDLKKMYASHVLENASLSRQKCELEHAKAKRMQELSHNEQVFLRKYAKYAGSAYFNRRSSFGSGVIRNCETKTKQQRPQSQMQTLTRDKSFGRESVSNECPYSFETWNRLVDGEADIIQQQKNEILFDGEKRGSMDDAFLSSSNVINRRHSCKPVFTFDEDRFDYRLQNFGATQRSGRRHTLSSNAPLSPIGILKTSTQSQTKKADDINNNLEKRVPSPCEKKLEKSVSFDKKNVKSRTRYNRRFSASDIQSLRHTSSTNSLNINKGNKITGLTPVEEFNLVPNATVVVRGDTDDEACDELNVNKVVKSLESESSVVVDNIPETDQDLFEDDHLDVAVEQGTDVTDIEISNVSQSSSRASSRSSGRSRSLSIPDLQLLIDSHHGRAKLRYIAKLAKEMEKEEEAKLQKPTERKADNNPVITNLDLSNCRYLRCSSQTSETEAD